MIKFLGQRIFQMILVLFFVSIVVYSLIIIIPGDAATAVVGADASEEQLMIVREQLGLNEPVFVRYVKWVGNMLKGDFGRSMTTNHRVTTLVSIRFPITMQLTLCGMVLAVSIGIPLGIIAAKKNNSFTDMVLRAITSLGMSLPNFWLGLLLILFFSLKLGWFAPSGLIPIKQSFFGWMSTMILPALTIGTRFTAVVLRQTRSALLEVLRSDYIRTAKAKGLKDIKIIRSHALKNSLIPVVTVIGLQTGRLFGGAVITETIFHLPGMGSLIATAVSQRDYVVVQSGIMIVAITVLLINFIVDVLYAILDPRIRFK
ncbi:MAG: ABC transporter permease [Balneolaceae bacterium]